MSTSLIKKDWAHRVLQADTPVLVKFGADWCGPCKMVDPILEQVDARDDISVLSVDIDATENEGLANQFNVRGVPTMILFQKGHELNRLVGAQSKSQIDAFIDQHL